MCIRRFSSHPAIRAAFALLAVGAALQLSLPAAAQNGPGSTRACNERGREGEGEVGLVNWLHGGCGVLSFSVGELDLTSSGQCAIGGAYVPDRHYRCSGEVSEGVHCRARGRQVEYYSYMDGGCAPLPNVSAFAKVEWESWSQVPAEVARTLRCVKPRKSSRMDWSAVVVDCEDGQVVAPNQDPGTAHEGAGGTRYRHLPGPADDLFRGEAFNYFLTEHDLAQTAEPTRLAGTLGAVASAHARVDGLWAQARVNYLHYDPGAVEASHLFGGSVTGTMTSSGRFDLQRSYTLSSEDGPRQTQHRTTFDGGVLRDLGAGAPTGHAILPTAANWQIGVDTYSMLPTPLFWWVFDPFELPAFEGMAFTELPGTHDDQLIVQVMYDSANGPYVGLEYTIDISQALPRPLSRLVLTRGGDPVTLTEYSDYQDVGTDVWRPFSIVQTVFHQWDDADEPALRVELTIASARLLAEDESSAVPAAFAEDLGWIVWE